MLNEVIIAFAIVAICVVIHTLGMLTFARWMLKRRALIYGKPRLMKSALLLITVFAVVIFLHLTEAALWAGFYWSQSLFENFETSFYFSLTSYTTIGFGDVILPTRWRLLGAVEGISGVLLCGVSTAFIFATVSVLFRASMENAEGEDKR